MARDVCSGPIGQGCVFYFNWPGLCVLLQLARDVYSSHKELGVCPRSRRGWGRVERVACRLEGFHAVGLPDGGGCLLQLCSIVWGSLGLEARGKREIGGIISSA